MKYYYFIFSKNKIDFLFYFFKKLIYWSKEMSLLINRMNISKKPEMMTMSNEMNDENEMMSKNEITTAEFKKFLYSFKDEGNFNTHVGMLEGMRGTFQFNRKGIEELYDIIGENKNLLFGVAEKPRDNSMFRLDIDRKIEGDEPRRLFSDDDILNKVKEVQTLLLTSISKEFFKSNLVDCVLLEKEPYINDKGQISNGYHLQFPNLFLSKENIKKIIENQEKLIKKLMILQQIHGLCMVLLKIVFQVAIKLLKYLPMMVIYLLK